MFDKLITDIFAQYDMIVYVHTASYRLHLHYNPAMPEINAELVNALI